MTYLVWPIVGILLLVVLFRRRTVNVPPGFGVWMLFLAWMLLSVTQINASDRMMAWAYRGTMYLSATALFLYLYNEPRRSLATKTIFGVIAAGWAMIAVGGLVGDLLPGLTLKSPLQLLLPSGLKSIPLVSDMITPAFSKQNAFGGLGIHRTQAPFPYPNAWGSNFALLTPFALYCYARATGRRKTMWGVLLVASVAPFVLSLDRGAWLALALGLAYAGLRLTQANDGRVVRWGVPVVVALLLAVVFTPLGGVVVGRIQRNYSDQGRIGRNLIAIDLVGNQPVLGYGAPQAADDNPANASVGTHGQLWLVLVSQGIPGALLFLGWMGLILVRSGRRLRSANDVRFWPHLTAAMAIVMLPYYELLPLQLFTLMATAAIVFRDGVEDRLPPRPLSSYVSTIWSRRWLVVSIAVVATFGTLAFTLTRSPSYSSTATVAIGNDVVSSSVESENNRLVTESEIAVSPGVIATIPSRLPAGLASVNEIRAGLAVRAVPDARVLEFTMLAGSPRTSRLVANAAADAYLARESDLLTSEQAAKVERLRRELNRDQKQLNRAVRTVATNPATSAVSRAAATDRDRLNRIVVAVANQIREEEARAADIGTIITRATVGVRTGRGPALPAATAGGIGLILGCVLAFALTSERARVRRVDEVSRVLGIPVLAVVSPRGRAPSDGLALRDRPGESEADSYRVLRTAVLGLLPEGRGSVVLCRGPGSRGEVASNLAAGLAMGGRRTALLDLVPGGGAPPGLLGRPLPRLSVVRPDRRARRGVRGFDGDAVAGALHTLTERHEVVVIDAPFAGIADVLPVARAASLVLVEVHARGATPSSLASMRQMLRRAEVAPAGVIVRGRLGG